LDCLGKPKPEVAGEVPLRYDNVDISADGTGNMENFKQYVDISCSSAFLRTFGKLSLLHGVTAGLHTSIQTRGYLYHPARRKDCLNYSRWFGLDYSIAAVHYLALLVAMAMGCWQGMSSAKSLEDSNMECAGTMGCRYRKKKEHTESRCPAKLRDLEETLGKRRCSFVALTGRCKSHEKKLNDQSYEW
jgi:hypothetical protein